MALSSEAGRVLALQVLALAISLAQLHLELGQGADPEENCPFLAFLSLHMDSVPDLVGRQKACPVTRTASGMVR